MPGDLLRACEELGSRPPVPGTPDKLRVSRGLVGRERAEPSWRPGRSLSYLLYTGPLCSVCVNRFGCRPVMLVGGLFASLGMVAASFCRSIIQIYLTTGVVTGELGGPADPAHLF